MNLINTQQQQQQQEQHHQQQPAAPPPVIIDLNVTLRMTTTSAIIGLGKGCVVLCMSCMVLCVNVIGLTLLYPVLATIMLLSFLFATLLI